MGNLTRDPEMRHSAKGTAMTKVGMAVNRKWRNEAGETKEEVTFVDVDLFGRTAESVAKYLRKGSALLVEGRLKFDTWEPKDAPGTKRSRLGVVGELVQFVGGRKSESGSTPATAPATTAEPETKTESEDDVPF